jgi:hypothetical protein
MTDHVPTPRESLRARRLAQAGARQQAAVRERIDLLRRSDPAASPEPLARRSLP